MAPLTPMCSFYVNGNTMQQISLLYRGELHLCAYNQFPLGRISWGTPLATAPKHTNTPIARDTFLKTHTHRFILTR